MAVEMKKELLSVKDVKQITGWSLSTIYKLVKSGQLKSINVPNTPISIRTTELDALLNGAFNEQN